jgi:hypothetical protein
MFATMGNHDNDGAVPYGPDVDFLASAKYRKAFGPTYYSINIGKIHYVMLDNIIYRNQVKEGGKKGKNIVGSRNYDIAFTREQLDWLAADLKDVDKSTPVVLAAHSPIFRYANYMDAPVAIRLPEEQQQEFVSLLKDFKTVHILSGHTHRNRCCYGKRDTTKPEIANITEHTVVAVSGARWHTSAFGGPQIGVTGEPSGCKIFPIDGTDIKWYFKPTEFDASTQFRCFDMNAVRDYFATNGEVKVFLDHFPARTNYAEWPTENAVMVHVWDWAPDWKIEMTENGKPLAVKRKKAENPQMIVGLDIPNTVWLIKFDKKNNKRKPHPHMFHVTASAPDTTIEVTVTDGFGNEYHQTMERPKPFSVHMK